MSFSFGGLVLKQAGTLSDDHAVSMIKGSYKYQKTVSVQEATGRELEGIGVLPWSGMIIIFGRDLPYSCALEPGNSTDLNETLINLSNQHEILCFTLNGISESYGWVYYHNGKVMRTRSFSSGKELFNLGEQTSFEQNGVLDEKSMTQLVGDFIGTPLSTLLRMKEPVVKIYNTL